jgi:hypothetical protein
MHIIVKTKQAKFTCKDKKSSHHCIVLNATLNIFLSFNPFQYWRLHPPISSGATGGRGLTTGRLLFRVGALLAATPLAVVSIVAARHGQCIRATSLEAEICPVASENNNKGIFLIWFILQYN